MANASAQYAGNIYLPQILKIGAGTSREIIPVLQELGLSKPFIVTDPFMAECGYLEKITAPLTADNIAFGSFNDCIPDPTTDSINSALDSFNTADYDCIICLGGGSSLDTGKALAVLARHGGHIQDYKFPNPVPKGYPIIAIPTTAGTGSEATRVTVVTDTATDEKLMCLGIGFLPTAALVDYELTLTMPFRLTADTGLDTLCHALEAYVSRKANAFTDPIALECLRTVSQYLTKACHHPDDHEARAAMMLAATQGGIAFSNASVTLIHGMSRPIGAAFHVPHGMSNAMLLPRVTEYSVAGAPERYAKAARVMGFADAADGNDVANEKLVARLYELCKDLEVPTLAQFGVKEETYSNLILTMSSQALASGSPGNNPVVPSEEDIVELYRKVW